MKRSSYLALVIVLVTALSRAQSNDHAKILDVRGFSVAGSPIIAPNNGYPVVIATSSEMFILQVAIGDMAYSGQFQQSRHIKPADFIVGDFVSATIVKDKLVVIAPEGKKVKGKIVRRERLVGNDSSSPSSPALPVR